MNCHLLGNTKAKIKENDKSSIFNIPCVNFETIYDK